MRSYPGLSCVESQEHAQEQLLNLAKDLFSPGGEYSRGGGIFISF